MNNLKKYLPPLLVLSFFLGSAIGFHSLIMTNIIEPIAVLLWAFWRIVSSVNQNNYWMILIVCCSILALRLVSAGNRNHPNSAYNYKHRVQSRVEYWQSLLTNAMMERQGVEHLRSNLKELLISMVEQEEHSNPGNSEEFVSKGQTPLPISAHDFLFPPKRKYKMFSGGYPLQLLFLTPGWFQRRAGKFIQPDNTPIDEVLKWMESAMEINHDK